MDLAGLLIFNKLTTTIIILFIRAFVTDETCNENDLNINFYALFDFNKNI